MLDDAEDTVLVRARDLARAFAQGGADLAALHPASFAIRPGDRIAIMGASGSGKSTLLHLLAGLDAPTSGAIAWPVLGPATSLRPGKVTIAFQSPSLVAALGVGENVALPLVLLGDEEDAATRVRSALDMFGVGDLADKLPEELSGGQAQRVALARAVVTNPRLILADEPTGQVDQATGRALVQALLAWAGQASRAVVVATHDTAVAAAFTEVWRMDHGQLTRPAAGNAK